MSIKLIAIGNRIMSDEGIAVRIAEKLMVDFLKEEVEVITAETVSDISSELLKNTELYIILDATCYNIQPGTITIVPIKRRNLYLNNFFVNNEVCLYNNIPCNDMNVTGYILGIEIERISFNTNLSDTLENKFDIITEKIKSLIKIIKYCKSNLDLNLNIVQNQINCPS